MEQKTMNVEQAIDYLEKKHGVKRSRRTFYMMIQQNELPYYRFKKNILVEPADLDNWVFENLSKKRAT